MKDRKLEEQFSGYFEGMNVPENLAEDAKKYVKAPSALPRFYKFVSVAASIIIVFAVALVLVFRPFAADGGEDPDFDGTNSPDAVAPSYYSDGDVTLSAVSGYSLAAIDPALAFMEKFAYASNADVTAQRAEFSGGETAFVKAEVVQIAGARYDAEILVDFSGKVYEPTASYMRGEQYYFKGVSYALTEGEIDGEPNYKIYAEKGRIKYYISVTSSDTQSYLRYLEIIF